MLQHDSVGDNSLMIAVLAPASTQQLCVCLQFTVNVLASPDHLVFMQLWNLIAILHKLFSLKLVPPKPH